MAVLQKTGNEFKLDETALEHDFPPLVFVWLNENADALDIEWVDQFEQEFDVWLVFLPVDRLKWLTNKGKVPCRIGEKLMKPTHDGPDRNPVEDAIRPMLFTGLLEMDYRPEDDTEKAALQAQLTHFIRENIDPRLHFFDSCIWFRYLPLHRLTDETAGLKSFLADFERQKPVFGWLAAHEFREFQGRLFDNSFIHRFADASVGVHGGSVTPFSFHSETGLHRKADKEDFPWLKHLKWRLLLVDDYADKHMACRNQAQTSTAKTSKGQLIHQILTADGNVQVRLFKRSATAMTSGEPGCQQDWEKILMDSPVAKPDSPQLDIHFVKNFDEAFSALRCTELSFDVLLLDYLFLIENSGSYRKEFAEQFLKDLLLPPKPGVKSFLEEEENRTGAFRRLHILPISVYQNALTDKLRDLGIPLYGKKWSFSAGADPVCTPGLFRHELLGLMRRQVDDLTKTVDERPKSRLVWFLNELKSGNDSELARWVDGFFPEIVALNESFKRLYRMRNRSLFAHSMWKKFFFSLDPDTMNRLQRLIDQLANGSPNRFQHFLNLTRTLPTELAKEIEAPLAIIGNFIGRQG